MNSATRSVRRLRRSTLLSSAVRPVIVEGLEGRTLFSALTIAQENALPGTPQSVWDVQGNGDAKLQGFAANISVNVGQTEAFKIDDTGASPYHLNIYRIGYYQGNGARLVASIPSSQTQAVEQPSEIQDPVTGMIDASNWSATASWAVPADATSGVYVADVVRDSNGGTSQIQFVVRNDASHSDILFKTSDATQQAYNEWGGASLYEGNGPGVAPAAGRSYAVSYQRPFDDRGRNGGLGSTNTFFYGEMAMARFLEANGYDVSYQTDVDTARSGAAVIEQHKVFMNSGHDEYWSGQERAAVTQARDAGVNINFFSGNTMYWKTRYGTNADGSANYNVMVCYKQSLAGTPADPSGLWTGEWADPNFTKTDSVTPQNQLTGTTFTVNRGPNDTGTPMTVPYAMSRDRLWRNTSVAAIGVGQVATIGTSVLGYEWDVDVDNGFRPSGLIDLSATTQTASQVILNPPEDLAAAAQTHSLTLYRASSGALVFNAATVQWSWGLDAGHDGPSAPTDPDIQQATVNLFADEGAQPATLRPSLTPAFSSTDHTAPVAALTLPAASTVVEQNGFATITGTAADIGGVVAGVEVSVNGGATWRPAAGQGAWSYTWAPAAAGAVTVLTRATDDSGNTQIPAPGVSLNVVSGDGSLSLFPATALPAVQSESDPSAVELGVKFTSDVSGFVTAIRFFKGSGNSGGHTGELWTSTGQLLGTATFSNETASGWQTVTFGTPIAVAAHTTYIASYHTSVGNYSDTIGAFVAGSFTGTGGVNHNTLHAPADGASGPNGVYAYSSSVTFPTTSSGGTNYWVDVVFSPTTPVVSPPTIIGQTPAAGATNVATGTSVSATFDQSIQLPTLTFILTDANNIPVAAALSYSNASNTATLTPKSPLAVSATYKVTVSGAIDTAGIAMTAPVTWSFTTAAVNASVPITIWSDTTIPAVTSDPDNNAIELGVKFRSDASGYIDGIRFYKGAQNIGPHVGNLWSSAGVLLATVTFANETAGGWETGYFSQPVAVAANTTYVASYHTVVGHYADTAAYFATSGANNGTLHALANGVDGADGVYLYGSGGFPNQSYNATNYWVDVVYNSTPAPPDVPPQVTSITPAGGSSGVSIAAPVTIAFSEALDPATVNNSTIQLLDGTNSVVPAAVTYNAAANTVTLTPVNALANSAAYTVVIAGGVTDPRIKDPNGGALPATVTAAFTTAAPAGVPLTLFPASAIPGAVTVADPNAVELGVKIRTDVPGLITGVRFYKGPSNTGIHLGNLWSSAGQLLATATFTNETASGWQTVSFSQPVAIQANTTYVASYHTNVGEYSATGGYFAAGGVNDGPLHGLADGADGGDGVYLYSSASAFPSQTFNGTNYWVDVVFQSSAATPTPPAVVSVSPAAGAIGVASSTTVAATFSKSIQPSTLSLVLTDPNGKVVPAAVAYVDATRTATLTPTVALSPLLTYTATVIGATDLAGNALPAPATWSFTTAPQAAAPSVTGETPAPGTANVGTNVAPTATFSGAVNPATVTSSTVQLVGPGSVIVAASVSYNAATFTATLTPNALLVSGTTYTVVVVGGPGGVSDNSGNALAATVAWTFSTNIPWTQSTQAAFGAGLPGAGVAVTAGGVQLSLGLADEFAGSSLSSANWTTTPTANGASVSVSGGAVSVKGAAILSTATYVTPSVDGRIAFGRAPRQAFGVSAAAVLGGGVTSAVFTTSTSTTTLFATVTAGGTTKSVNLGAIPGGFHIYRVQPTSAAVNFLIDGALVATVTKALPATALGALLTAFRGGASAPIQADYAHVLYPPSGAFVSSVFDATRSAVWGVATWTATSPPGSGVQILTRSGNSAVPDGTWSAWQAVVNGGTVASPSGRYLQYELVLSTSDPAQTPGLGSVTFQWS